MEWWEWPLLVLAAHRLTRLAIADDFPPVKWARDWLLRRWPGDDTEFPDHEVEPSDDQTGFVVQGTDTRVVAFDRDVWVPIEGHWLGNLITCPWCIGFWICVAVLGPWLWADPVWWLAGSLAASSLVGFLSRLEP